jgi:hypothetical protein
MFFLSGLGYLTSAEFEAMAAVNLVDPLLMPAYGAFYRLEFSSSSKTTLKVVKYHPEHS